MNDALMRDRIRMLRGEVMTYVNGFRMRQMPSMSVGQLVHVINSAAEHEVKSAIDYCVEAGYLRDATHRLDHGDTRPMDSVAITKTGIDLVDRTITDGGIVLVA